ncbi:hypothetical protein EXIGLDRAFT_758832 [Exidia glandulosa HHB12029]|uniref:Uncharacterized protein n=1 Tax=Exidia glandulosa HHB12029 TaxID=1314781 RepID=A0A165QE91_EXIGL|nr:hypothetical protein EXIGLDRAFT_758832 [Exidia glandulosa HHB12029]
MAPCDLTAILVLGVIAVLALVGATAAVVVKCRKYCAQRRAKAAKRAVQDWVCEANAAELVRTHTDTSCPTPPVTPTTSSLASFSRSPFAAVHQAYYVLRSARAALDHFSLPIHIPLPTSPRQSADLNAYTV